LIGFYKVNTTVWYCAYYCRLISAILSHSAIYYACRVNVVDWRFMSVQLELCCTSACDMTQQYMTTHTV